MSGCRRGLRPCRRRDYESVPAASSDRSRILSYHIEVDPAITVRSLHPPQLPRHHPAERTTIVTKFHQLVRLIAGQFAPTIQATAFERYYPSRYQNSRHYYRHCGCHHHDPSRPRHSNHRHFSSEQSHSSRSNSPLPFTASAHACTHNHILFPHSQPFLGLSPMIRKLHPHRRPTLRFFPPHCTPPILETKVHMCNWDGCKHMGWMEAKGFHITQRSLKLICEMRANGRLEFYLIRQSRCNASRAALGSC